jgi:pimeloyl-ACP methyl ester carboxylesterase
VVVDHSLGGATAALVAAKRPVRHFVYLCAFPPESGRSLVEQWRSEPDSVNPDWDKGLSEPDPQLRTPRVDLDIARALFYADCDEQTVTAAFNRLRPSQLARSPHLARSANFPRRVVRMLFALRIR